MDYKEILNQIRSIIICPVCHRRFDIDKIKLFGVVDDKLVMQTFCAKSHTPINAIIVSNLIGSEISTVHQSEQISANNVLDLKNKLKKFNGNFEKIFNVKEKVNGRVKA